MGVKVSMEAINMSLGEQRHKRRIIGERDQLIHQVQVGHIDCGSGSKVYVRLP
jgi:hypothetical protein